jgi:diketogulonate reductase-like aldo/keto reductase
MLGIGAPVTGTPGWHTARANGCANMTLDEERTLFANWAVISSPLVLAFDTRDEQVVKAYWPTVTNRLALEINSAWAGSAGSLLKQSTAETNRSVPVGMRCEENDRYAMLPNWLIYLKPLPRGRVAALAINLGETELSSGDGAAVSLAELLAAVANASGWPSAVPSSFSAVDVWTGEARPTVSDGQPWSAVGLSAHNSSFVVFSPAPASQPRIRLTNAADDNVLMPVTGLGTGCAIGGCTVRPGSDQVAYNMSRQWFKLGGRRIDAADSYGCEPGIGRALKDSGVPREEAFIESKTGPGGLCWPLGYNETLQQGRAIARNYSVAAVDLLLIHWPVNYGPCAVHGPVPSIPTTDAACDSSTARYNETTCRLNTWRGMLDLWREGVARAVGVSNYNSSHIAEIEAAGLPLPAVNQVPFSPPNGPNARCNHATPSPDETCAQLIEFCRARGIVVNGYSPYGGEGGAAKVLSDPRLLAIAASHNTTAAKVVLAWEYSARGVLVNPESQNPEHQQESLEFFGVHLSGDEVQTIDNWASTA